MAFDKVVDSAVLESGLTSIANAIREKGGTSDALAFPAGFVEAIAAIQAGGNDIEWVTGTITPATATTVSQTKVDLTGGLTKAPNLFVIYNEPSASEAWSNKEGVWAVIQIIKSYTPVDWNPFIFTPTEFREYMFRSKTSAVYVPDITSISGAAAGAKYINNWQVSLQNTSLKVVAGKTYRYFAVSGVTI